MSKKHHKHGQASFSNPSPVSQDHAIEYGIIKHDLIRVLILNVIVLAAVLTLYYTNLHSGYLNTLAAKLLHL